MSTADADVTVPDAPGPDGQPGQLTTGRVARVGDIEVRRLLPLRHRRSVGAWCFVDHYGPMSVDGVTGMQVPPHPHIGLQTVTWLLDGNVLHRDSLGSEQMIRPGQLNLMTAGRGIAHAEESPAEHDPRLHGVQLWLALPGPQRQVAPGFEHHAALPAWPDSRSRVRWLAGRARPRPPSSPRWWGPAARGPGHPGPARPGAGYEHVIFMVAGTAEAAGQRSARDPAVPPAGTDQVTLAATAAPAVPARRHPLDSRW